jgi:hypothetical protein
VLFDSVNDVSAGGKLGGRGACSAFESRCSSVREAKEAIVEGMVPSRDVLERSLKGGGRVSCVKGVVEENLHEFERGSQGGTG